MEKQEGSIQSEGVPERDRMEQALRKSEQRYRFLFERSPAVNLVIGADGRIRDVTNSFADRLGYSNDEIVGRQALEFVVAEQREKVAAVLEMAFKGEDTPEMDVDVYAKDGSVHTVFFSPGQVVLKEEGRPTSVLFTGVDITERKRAEEALRKSEERYRLLIERQREGLTIVDLEEQFVFCNPAGNEIFGVPRGGLVGRNVREFTTPETFELIRKQTEKRLSGESSSYEIEITRPDGEKRQLLTTATPWLDKDERIVGALAIFRDETERKRAERQIHRQADLLEKTFDSMTDAVLILDAKVPPTIL
ncbi:MAG: PAS domain-containing protein, partial [Candidatus Bathyarchaeia archaeon]